MDASMTTKIDIRRILIFLAFAFGIAWAAALVIYLTGGLVGSPQIGSGFTLALLLMATVYMWAPALANILTRLITREGWKEMGLRPHFKKGWLYWLIAWILPSLMTVAGAALFFVLFPRYFDSSLSTVRQMTAKSPSLGNLSPWTVLIIQLVQGVLLSPILNSIATFGEEFGWRAYLQPRLMPLGGRKTMLLIGLIWGIWHWPVIFMGYEYGFSYPGYPWVGPLLFLWVTFGLGIFLGWLTLRSKSVWPAVIGHAAINGIAGAAFLVVIGNPNPLLGPLPVGIIASMGFAAVSLAIFFSPRGLKE
jgi:membrane protease YdiL (CAAX protease family)